MFEYILQLLRNTKTQEFQFQLIQTPLLLILFHHTKWTFYSLPCQTFDQEL